MAVEKQLVTEFYERIWNAHDRNAIAAVMSPSYVFRGSLGDEKRGHDGFAENVDKVHDGLSNYRCFINELVSKSGRAFARMTFVGTHSGNFLGYPPSGIDVSWAGAARFVIKNGQIVDVWVLGDLYALHDQLAARA